jgi:hypothetical protein
MINLVAFDVCTSYTLHETVNPLVKEIHIVTVGEIPANLKAHIRKALKSDARSKLALIGKVDFSPGVTRATVYLRGLREPAYTRQEAGTPSETE